MCITKKYIWQSQYWPSFEFDATQLTVVLSEVNEKIGVLEGRMTAMGFPAHSSASVESLTHEIVQSSDIESERLCTEDVRSSVIKNLGLDAVILSEYSPASKKGDNISERISSIVKIVMDAVINCNTPLTEERLFSWHTLLFSESRSGRYKIITGAYRTDENGSMQVISGSIGREIVHYQAPPASVVPQMMEQFLKWFNTSAADQGLDAVLKSAIAHIYFVSIHPFEDGNGRIARAIADMALHRSTSLRTRDHLFSMSAQLSKERKEYYTQLESAQTLSSDTINITEWLRWYIQCMERAVDNVLAELDSVSRRKALWEEANKLGINERQRKILSLLIPGEFKGNLTSSKWALICNCSHDTASRDIKHLIDAGLLRKSESEGRSTFYYLRG